MTQALPLPATAEPRPRRPVRIVTAASLFDGHDAAINVMRRIIQASGAEVIHLGHNRSVAEIVECAIQEDAHGHRDHVLPGRPPRVLQVHARPARASAGADILIFGGGGGTILPHGDRGAAPLRHHPHLHARRRPRDGPAGHDRRPAPPAATARRAPIDLEPRWCRGCRRATRTRSRRLISLAENEPERVADLREALAARARHRARPRCSASPARAAPASRRWSTSWCAAS